MTDNMEARLATITLTDARSGGMGVVEAVALLAGEMGYRYPSGYPRALCPVIGAVVDKWGEWLRTGEHDRWLKPLLPVIVHSRTDVAETDVRRAQIATDCAVREILPALLERLSVRARHPATRLAFTRCATALRSCPNGELWRVLADVRILDEEGSTMRKAIRSAEGALNCVDWIPSQAGTYAAGVVRSVVAVDPDDRDRYLTMLAACVRRMAEASPSADE